MCVLCVGHVYIYIYMSWPGSAYYQSFGCKEPLEHNVLWLGPPLNISCLRAAQLPTRRISYPVELFRTRALPLAQRRSGGASLRPPPNWGKSLQSSWVGRLPKIKKNNWALV